MASVKTGFPARHPTSGDELPGVALVTIDRPPVLNALDSSTMADAPLRSLAVPGWGQLELGQRRGWAYLALEAAGWAVFINRHRRGASLRDDYRDLAWTAGRLQNGARVDGDLRCVNL